jgi:hypothetical protein
MLRSGAEVRAVPSHTVAGYTLAALVLIGAVFYFLSLAPRGASWPEGLPVGRSGDVAVIIGLCGVPWLVLAWLLQRHFANVPRGDAPSIEELRNLWDLLNAIVLAFAVFVVVALVTTGALRAVYFAGDKDPAPDKQGAEFPSSDVLLYGAYFAVLLSAIALPMVAAYRSAARRRVTLSCRIPSGNNVPTSDEKDAVDRVETLLHLDIGFLRSPITALAVFTPLITAALAAYLPDLAS